MALRGCLYRCQGARLPALPAQGSLRVIAPAQLGAQTPFLPHLPQPFQVVLQQTNGEDDNVFSSKKGEGGCDPVGQQSDGRCGRRSGFQPAWGLLVCYFCSALIFWLTMCAKLASDLSSLYSHTKGKNLSLASSFFISFSCFPCLVGLLYSVLLLPSSSGKSCLLTVSIMISTELLWFSWENFSTFIL